MLRERYEEAVKALLQMKLHKVVQRNEFGVDQHAKRGDYAIFLNKAFLATR